MKEKISDGDYVLLYSKGKTWLVKVQESKDFHTHLGRLELGRLIGEPYGKAISTDSGNILYALKPTIEDFVMKCERQTQIVYPKDLGLIAIRANLASGARVIEAGSGSGALTMFLAHLVKKEGRVYSYEIREEFQKIARRNVKRAGLDQYVEFKLKDASQGFDEEDVDAVIIDVGDPWQLIPKAVTALKESGSIICITPTMNQTEKVAEEMKNAGLVRVQSFEVFLRGIEARLGKTRPSSMMIGHTAYITSAVKVV
ncbi:MAG: tRNA (adenine-N1)-methyltransferase [Nitrososphaerota archaeon]